jgi:hypothetical protein
MTMLNSQGRGGRRQAPPLPDGPGKVAVKT